MQRNSYSFSGRSVALTVGLMWLTCGFIIATCISILFELSGFMSLLLGTASLLLLLAVSLDPNVQEPLQVEERPMTVEQKLRFLQENEGFEL